MYLSAKSTNDTKRNILNINISILYRSGLKAFNCVYTYDENSILNSATNRVKSLKNGLKELEIALSSEIGALRVSWEVYMNKIVSLKQDADLADLFLALDDSK